MDATAKQILNGYTAYTVNGEAIEGAMPYNGPNDSKISSITETCQVLSGYHDGTGTIGVKDTEQAKIIPENIKSGVSILGVQGTYKGEIIIQEPPTQIKFVTPYTTSQDISPDEGYFSRIFVEPIMYTEAENAAGGETITIGEGEGSVRANFADLSNDTITPDKLLEGYTAHDANGAQITGTFQPDIDYTQDTVTPEVLLQGYTAHNANGEQITGTNIYDANTSDATALDFEIVSGKTAYVNGAKLIGSMVNNGAVSVFIKAKDTVYTIPEGYHDGNGSVAIINSDQDKIIPENIKSGITILGVTGTHEGNEGYAYVSNDTVTPDVLLQGYTAHNANGEQITGIHTYKPAVLIAPYYFDLHPCMTIKNNGNILISTELYWTDKEKPYIDVYQAIANHSYTISLGAQTFNRFCVTFITEDIIQELNIKQYREINGQLICFYSDPEPYKNATFIAPSNGWSSYLGNIRRRNNSNTGN